MDREQIIHFLQTYQGREKLKSIGHKVAQGNRLTPGEALYLYEHAELSLLGVLASLSRQKWSGNKVFFNRNFHVEPTNICVFKCKFCSYSRSPGQAGSWDHSLEDILDQIDREIIASNSTEVHIVGGVHPDHDLYYYGEMIQKIHEKYPSLQIKAFSAVELAHVIHKAGLSFEEGLLFLKNKGLQTIPGGGAEIFDPTIRQQICKDKITGKEWLALHETAHGLSIPTNATMLYGHMEKYTHRVEHMLALRDLQDRTRGFNAFIPLKFRKANNPMGHLGEVSIVEDMKNFAISRLFLDNFSHVKAYWPMIGKDAAMISLSFGVDDIDGTIEDSTKIYSMAGAEETNPSLTEAELVNMIKKAGYQPVERDSFYKALQTH
jgi:aminodeoxyfutalosine synthase